MHGPRSLVQPGFSRAGAGVLRLINEWLEDRSHALRGHGHNQLLATRFLSAQHADIAMRKGQGLGQPGTQRSIAAAIQRWSRDAYAQRAIVQPDQLCRLGAGLGSHRHDSLGLGFSHSQPRWRLDSHA